MVQRRYLCSLFTLLLLAGYFFTGPRPLLAQSPDEPPASEEPGKQPSGDPPAEPQPAPEKPAWWDRSIPASHRGSISPNKAALLGIVPGLGQAVLGNYGTAMFQFGLFSGSIASAGTLASRDDYIEFEDRRVTYDLEEVLLGRELSRQGVLYSDNALYTMPPFSLETAYDRQMRMIKDGKIAETNPLVEYGEYNRTNTRTEMAGAYGLMAQSTIFYSVYSSYRDAGGGRHDERIEELLIAPFRWKYLSSPWVYVPLAFLAGAIGSSGPSNDTTLVNDRFMNDGTREFLTVYQSMNAAVAEEAFFRGYMNHTLSRRHGPFTGGLISGTLFGLAHLQGGAPVGSVLPQTMYGYYFAFLQHKNGGDIREGIALHFWWDVIIFAYQFQAYKADRRHSRSKMEVNFMPISYTMRF